VTDPGAPLGDDPHELVAVEMRSSSAGLNEPALVLRAVGIEANQVRRQGMHALVVPRRMAVAARRELQRYRDENPDEAEPSMADVSSRRPLARVWPGALAYSVPLCLVYAIQHGGLLGGRLVRELGPAGRTDAAAILDGQVWRCITALTLHVDVPHLTGNLVFGLVFGSLLAQLVGSGLGWCAILVGGGLGNLANAALQRPEHLSMGASTAVFAALGVLTALSLRLAPHLRHGRWRRWAPLAMGVALLGLLGTGGERTDVAAHALGFVAGILLGLGLVPWVRREPPSYGVQLGFAALACGLLIGSWILAWPTAG